ncbi:MAG: PLP-dependent aminotransferase family protein, partial [Methyloligellaceae bacterium]
ALADFIDEGHFARHVRRMRTLYAERQAALVEAAARDLGGIMTVPAADAGLHLVGWLDGAISEPALLRAAASVGIELAPTSWFSMRDQPRKSVLLGYAPFPRKELRIATQALSRACERLDKGAA